LYKHLVSAQSILIKSLEKQMLIPAAEFLSDTYCPNLLPVARLPRTERIVVESRTGSPVSTAPPYRQAVITTDEATTARFKTFFPGWTAALTAPMRRDPAFLPEPS
jgi:hypothetical protein